MQVENSKNGFHAPLRSHPSLGCTKQTAQPTVQVTVGSVARLDSWLARQADWCSQPGSLTS
jgi:hypothetical protein